MDQLDIHQLVQARRERAARRRRRVRLVLLLLASAILADAVVGENGVMAWKRARREYETVQLELQRLRAERERLRAEIRRLLDDPRAIEEVARRELGLARPDETVVVVVPAPPRRVP